MGNESKKGNDEFNCVVDSIKVKIAVVTSRGGAKA